MLPLKALSPKAESKDDDDDDDDDDDEEDDDGDEILAKNILEIINHSGKRSLFTT